MTNIVNLPLNKLTLWDGNVRKTNVLDGIDERAASIAAHGLLQSLVVKKDKRGKFAVVAGQRRFLALSKLAGERTIEKTAPVPCQVMAGSIDGTELSLAENAVRADMHPADQFEAFRTLIDKGATTAEVAARFGVTEIVVRKRLKLGRLSPVILEAYRDGKIGLDEAQAFAVSDDHAAQERVFDNLPPWADAGNIREALTKGEVQAASDKRVKFVGLEAYEAAGGTVRRDLFAEEGCYLQ